MEFKILDNLNEDIIAIRTEAFLVQRNVPKEVELDGRDGEMKHFCLYDGEKLVAYLRAECKGEILHIGRVAVSTELRKMGYGRQLLDYLCDYAKTQEYKGVELGAVHTAQGFYEKMGFVAEGDYYEETGVPHIYMKKVLKKSFCEKVKANFNSILALITAVLFVAGRFVSGTGYVYRPDSYTLFLSVLCILTICATVLSVRFRKKANRLSRVVGWLMPVFAFLGCWIFKAIDIRVDILSNSLKVLVIIFSAFIVSSLLICILHIPNKAIRIVMAVLSVLFVIIFMFFATLAWLIDDFGKNTVIDTVNSPGDMYSAYAISSDQGALGGDTIVVLKDNSKDIKLLSGTLTTPISFIWSGGWMEHPDMEWLDDNVLRIDEKEYYLKNEQGRLEVEIQ